MHGAIGLQPILLEVAASRSSLCAPTGSRTGTSSPPVARQGSCTRGWPGAAGCPRQPRRRGTSRWPRCIRCAAPRPAGRCCRSRRGRSRYRCPIRARQRSSTAALCLQRWSSGSVCCSASVLGSRLLRLVPKRAPQQRAESTPKPATSALCHDCAHCVNRRGQLMTFRAGSMSGRAASDPSILVSAHRCPFGPPSTA